MGEPIAEVGYLAGLCQYTGSAWVKSNLLFGYNADYSESMNDTAAGADWGKYSTPVDANEVWVIQAASLRNATRVTGRIEIYILKADGSIIFLGWSSNLDQNDPLKWSGEIALSVGDKLRFFMAGSQLNDVIQGGVIGYKMKLNM